MIILKPYYCFYGFYKSDKVGELRAGPERADVEPFSFSNPFTRFRGRTIWRIFHTVQFILLPGATGMGKCLVKALSAL